MQATLKLIPILLGVIVYTLSASAQSVRSRDVIALRDTILALDSGLFTAFNNCDISAWRSYLAVDIEFYQDNDDVSMTRAELEPSFLARCGDNVSSLTRELLSESVEVHSIQGYGAVQLGRHRFWVRSADLGRRLASTPSFVHLWRRSSDGWQITRVTATDIDNWAPVWCGVGNARHPIGAQDKQDTFSIRSPRI